MRAKFYSIAHRVTKEEALPDLPPFQHERRFFRLGSKAAKLYGELSSEFHAAVESGEITAANALVRLLRLQQVTGGHVTTDAGSDLLVDTGKTELLADLMLDLPPQEPLAVFVRFQPELDAVRQVAQAAGRSCGELSGRTNDLSAWQAGQLNTLVVQIQAGGVGVDLTRTAYVVYYSLGFSLGDYEQSLARPHRPGQTRRVIYYHLIASGTVDEKVYAALSARKGVVESILAEHSRLL